MMKADLTGYLPGDILFYTKHAGALVDAAISAVEGGSPFVHVAVAVSALEKVEALFHGVVRTPITQSAIAASWSYSSHAAPLVPQNLARALAWLHSQEGQLYGLGDIVDALLWKVEHAVSLDVGDHYDCSALAFQFLELAGGVDLKGNVNPHIITPAALAALLGVTVADSRSPAKEGSS